MRITERDKDGVARGARSRIHPKPMTRLLQMAANRRSNIPSAGCLTVNVAAVSLYSSAPPSLGPIASGFKFSSFPFSVWYISGSYLHSLKPRGPLVHPHLCSSEPVPPRSPLTKSLTVFSHCLFISPKGKKIVQEFNLRSRIKRKTKSVISIVYTGSWWY